MTVSDRKYSHWLLGTALKNIHGDFSHRGWYPQARKATAVKLCDENTPLESYEKVEAVVSA